MSKQQPSSPGSPAAGPSRPSNPFRSSQVKPGAIGYLFLADESSESQSQMLPSDKQLAVLVEKLRANNWRGSIVGPHGTGKSTLLAALRPQIEAAGHPCSVIELHDGQRTLPWAVVHDNVTTGGVLAVDGYEQLSRWQAARLRRYAARRSLGLLVTTHQPPKHFPVLATTQADRATMAAVLRALLVHQPALLPRSLELATQLLPQHDGNLREVLFALYDAYEENALQAD